MFFSILNYCWPRVLLYFFSIFVLVICLQNATYGDWWIRVVYISNNIEYCFFPAFHISIAYITFHNIHTIFHNIWLKFTAFCCAREFFRSSTRHRIALLLDKTRKFFASRFLFVFPSWAFKNALNTYIENEKHFH